MDHSQGGVGLDGKSGYKFNHAGIIRTNKRDYYWISCDDGWWLYKSDRQWHPMSSNLVALIEQDIFEENSNEWEW